MKQRQRPSARKRRPRFVPSLVFATTAALGVVPACGGAEKSDVGQSGGNDGGSGGGQMIVLAIAGFSGSGGAGGGIIVLAVAGFGGSGYGGRPLPDSGSPDAAPDARDATVAPDAVPPPGAAGSDSG